MCPSLTRYQPVYKAGNETPVLVIGVVAAVLLAAGLLPPYGEAWKRRGRIIGINFVFLTIDSLGALFSLFSLVTQHTFDILGGVMYIVWYEPFVNFVLVAPLPSHPSWTDCTCTQLTPNLPI